MEVKHCGNTTNLRNHLTRHHPDIPLAKTADTKQRSLEKAFAMKLASTSPRAQKITHACVRPSACIFCSSSGAGGWSPMVTDQEPWLQVDLREQMEVTAVATQGRYDSWDWVSSYLLLYSDTGRAWKQYRHEDGVGRFVGNGNLESVVQNKLSHPVRTRFLRFVPLDWNPSGWMGLRVEVYGCSYKSYVADFDGRSSLLYRFNQKSMSTVKDVISLRFKSHQAEGVLLHGEGQRGDYITLELHRGRLDLYLNLGDSHRVPVTVGSLLDDQHWHSVHIERFNKQVNLTVDSYTQRFQTKGEGHSLEVDYELSFGGIPLPGKPGTFLRKNFNGCMENLYYNGINVIDLAKRRKPQIHSVVSCVLVACTFVSSSSSFLSLPSASPAVGGFSVRFQFRTWNPEGLLLSVQLNPDPQQLRLQISNSWLRLTLHSSGRQKSEVSAAKGCIVCYFHPGCAATAPDCQGFAPAFQGCMRLIFINSQLMNLSHVQQGLLGNYNELQFDTCNIKDRCLPNLCEHGARCSQMWSSFSCDCSGTGYAGATCHNSIYESSCEAYKLSGSSSGFYFIDPDGSGPLGPTQVYCNMTEKKVWTVLSHNSTAPVTVQTSSLQKPHVMIFNYSASAKQLRAIVSGSEQCQQEVVYNCRKSRLFNTKDGSPLSWWLDREGEKRSYWGGFLPGVQQCSCSLEENCIDMNYFCNCDADTDTWYRQLLSYKDHLPVSQIVIGDTDRMGSQAVYHIGPLRCYGDRSIWNAASFYQESSYLYFPTLQAELASDISFYFKTSAPSGVFLENQGLKDFIRVELSSPSVVTFSFDVGNGAAVLSVKSHVPLNDRQWHYVRAERNAKEASVQVDQLPLRFLEAPADGHLRLRLSSQLFVGTASQQRGFLGCIRSLTANGVSFDLEERAKMTPGVSAGCPGYCTGSSSLCHNRGRCVEKSNGYICDCSQSAYGGTTCNQGESLETTVQAPFSVMQNRSSQASTSSTDSRAREDVALSFVTSQRPAMLLTVSTFSQQYIAVILATNGTYRNHTWKCCSCASVFFVNANFKNMNMLLVGKEAALNNILVSEELQHPSHSALTERSQKHFSLLGCVFVGMENFDEEVIQGASKGFIGCLSSVQFNHVAPLKVALTNRGSSLVTVRGPLVQSNCGALAESHTLQGKTSTSMTLMICLLRLTNTRADCFCVVTAVVFITVCALAVVIRLVYQQRRAQRSSGSIKEEHRHSMYTDYRTELHLHNPVRDSVKEYYI
uniref:Contactin associated protein family member 5 n=1 Tax=Maylandia zebra TaxID=106582 RepID=A0A3P9BA33_9CICH